MILVTGGAGFIGANFVLDWLGGSSESVVNLDKLTYAGNLQNLASVRGDARHVFVQGDIGDSALVERLLAEHRPRAVVNFAAESHVDRSITGPGDFIHTNILYLKFGLFFKPNLNISLPCRFDRLYFILQCGSGQATNHNFL